MTLQRGETFKVLNPDGTIAPPGHPQVILYSDSEITIYSNITDIEKEDEVCCVLEPVDSPVILTKKSTFRYYSIKEYPTDKFLQAFNSGIFKKISPLESSAFMKILAGANQSKTIKPRYKARLARIEAEIRGAQQRKA